MRISMTGDMLAEALTGTFSGKVYDLAAIKLLRVGCPREISASAANRLNCPLVIDRNRSHYGKIQATGYCPDAVVVAGAYRREMLLANGKLEAMAWVDRDLNRKDVEYIGCGDLAAGITSALLHKLYDGRSVLPGQPWPLISELYPFNNKVVFHCGGTRYQQDYTIDPVDSTVSLRGEMTACATGMHVTSHPNPLAGNQVRNWGGLNSDLVRMVVRSSPSIDTAVSNLLSAIKNGLYKPMKPMNAHVNLSDDGKILGPLVEAGIAPVDYVVWADKQEEFIDSRAFSQGARKKLAKTGAAMPGGGFPIKNRIDVQNAVRAFGRAKDPAKTKAHIVKQAKKLGAMDLLPSHWKGGDISSFHKFHTPKMHDVGSPKKASFKAEGTSEGAEKGWESRERKGPSVKEQVENHLKKNGFVLNQSRGNSSGIDFWVKEAHRSYDSKGGQASDSSGTIRHSVAVSPDGSFTHTEEGIHHGYGLNDLTGIYLAALAAARKYAEMRR